MRRINYRSSMLVISAAVLFFVIIVYPRPFKTADLRDYLPIKLGKVAPIYGVSGLWSNCQLEVYDLGVFDGDLVAALNDLGPLSEEMEVKFSPWLSEVRSVLNDNSQYYAFDFTECDEDFTEKFFGRFLEESSNGFKKDGMIRIGGEIEFSMPLSHANVLIFGIKDRARLMLVIMKGGR